MDAIRNGNFTSSQAYRLMGTQKVMDTYIKEKRREKRLGTSINVETTSHSLSWGQIMQNYVFKQHMELSYTLQVDKPKMHKSGLWVGSEDVISVDTVGEIKCPVSRTSFCDYVDAIEKNDIGYLKSEQPEAYWQIVSNCDILGRKYGELIVWMPYIDEFPDIMEFISNIDDFDLQKDIQWVVHAPISRLPCIPNGRGYKNVNRFKFEIPEADRILLLEKVIHAYKLLNS